MRPNRLIGFACSSSSQQTSRAGTLASLRQLQTRVFRLEISRAARPFITRKSVRRRPSYEGLRQRLEAGLELPFHAYDLLKQLEVTDEGPIAAAILDISRDNRDVNATAVMAGPKTVGALVDKYLACAQALKVRRTHHDRAFE